MKRLLLIFIVLVFITFHIFSASPTLILGLGMNTILYPLDERPFTNDWFLNLDGVFSYRNNLSDYGYYSLFSSLSGDMTYTDPYFLFDEEIITIETGFQFEKSKLISSASFDSSITGTKTSLPFYSPDWEITYYFITERKKVHPFLSYQGYYIAEPDSNENIFYEGIEIGIEHRPAITTSYKSSISLGWEYWPEYPIYTDTGSLSEEYRNDLLIITNGKLSGIINYFFDWEIILSALIRISNTDNYIESIDYYEENSEDSIFLTSELKLEWSPSRYIHIQLNPYFNPEFYFNKQAFTSGGSLKNEKEWAFTAGGIFHVDWTFNNAIYFFFEFESIANYTNNPDNIDMITLFQLGIEYSHNFE